MSEACLPSRPKPQACLLGCSGHRKPVLSHPFLLFFHPRGDSPDGHGVDGHSGSSCALPGFSLVGPQFLTLGGTETSQFISASIIQIRRPPRPTGVSRPSSTTFSRSRACFSLAFALNLANLGQVSPYSFPFHCLDLNKSINTSQQLYFCGWYLLSTGLLLLAKNPSLLLLEEPPCGWDT